MKRLIAVALTSAFLIALAVPAFASAPTKSVTIGDDFYRPTSLKIKHGTKVVWKWTGMHTHNVTVVSGPESFHSADKSSGTYSHTFKKKGTWHLMCTIHGFTMTVRAT